MPEEQSRTSKVSGSIGTLTIPSRPWESVSLEFITHQPKVGEFDSILVNIGKFSKYATFIPTPKLYFTEMTTNYSSSTS